MEMNVNKKKYYSIIFIIILAVLSLFLILFYLGKNKKTFSGTVSINRAIINSAEYACQNDKTFSVQFFKTREPISSSTDVENMPTLDQSVLVKLDDGRNINLNQTLSADGGRYATPDDSFVFWDKGEQSFIYEFDQERFYMDCHIVDKNKNSSSFPSSSTLPQ